MDIGLTIKSNRLRQGLSQEQLARKAGVTQATVSKIESGERSGRRDTVQSILAVLGLRLGVQIDDGREAAP